MTEEGIPSEEETVIGEIETTTVVVSEAGAVAPEKCIRQFVLTVVLRPRYHSSHLKEDLFTAETVSQNTENSNSINLHLLSFSVINGNLWKQDFQIHFILMVYLTQTHN